MVNNWQNGAESFIDAVSSGSATPGGGAVAAFSAASGCALTMMAISVTMKMKSTAPQSKKELNEALDEFILLRDALKECAEKDADAYEEYISAKKLPAGSKEREEYVKAALEQCAKVPLETALKAVKTLQMTEEISPKIAPVIKPDIECAKIMLRAAIACGVENIKANMPYIKEADFKEELEKNINFLKPFYESIS